MNAIPTAQTSDYLKNAGNPMEDVLDSAFQFTRHLHETLDKAGCVIVSKAELSTLNSAAMTYAEVAKQLALALENADRLNSNVEYWGNADGGKGTYRDHSRAALEEYRELTQQLSYGIHKPRLNEAAEIATQFGKRLQVLD